MYNKTSEVKSMVISLNEKQKMFLFEKGYVTGKTLDSWSYEGWEKYFVDNFDWQLNTSFNWFKMRDLMLYSRRDSLDYELAVNLDVADFNTLMKLV